MEIIQENFEGALRLLNQGKFERATGILEKLVPKTDPRDVRPLLRLGECYSRLGRTPEAVRVFETAGKNLSNMGFHRNAIAVYKQLLGVTDNPKPVHLAMAVAYEELGLLADAAQHRRSATIEPTRAFQLADAETETFVQIPELKSSRKRVGASRVLVGMLLGAALTFVATSDKLDDLVAPESAAVVMAEADAHLATAKTKVRQALVDLAWAIAEQF